MVRIAALQAPADRRPRRLGDRSRSLACRWRRRGCRSSRSRSLLAASASASARCMPVTTVAIQNAVRPHQLGTATGAHELLPLSSAAPSWSRPSAPSCWAARRRHGGAIEDLGSVASAAGVDLAGVFRWTFAAAVLGLDRRARLPARDGGAAVAERQRPGTGGCGGRGVGPLSARGRTRRSRRWCRAARGRWRRAEGHDAAVRGDRHGEAVPVRLPAGGGDAHPLGRAGEPVADEHVAAPLSSPGTRFLAAESKAT